MKQALLSFLLVLLPILASAEAVEIGGIYYNLISKGNVAEVTTGYDKYSGEIIIPEFVIYNNVEYSVQRIKYDAFYDCKKLISLHIPQSIKKIDSMAFLGCDNLSSIYITDVKAWCNIEMGDEYEPPLLTNYRLFLNGEELKVMQIPSEIDILNDYVFSGCCSIVSVEIPDNITKIGQGAFDGCENLISINIPENVVKIGSCAFRNCKSLLSIVIPDRVTDFGESVFAECSNLKSVVLGDGVPCINRYCFSNCKSLSSITFGKNIKSIEEDGLAYCSSLTSLVIPEGVTKIGAWSIIHCTSLTNVSLPNSLLTIESGAFYGCTSLTSISLPNNMREIGNAFYNCTNLSSIWIGKGIKKIYSSAFANLQNLLHVYCLPDDVPETAGDAFSNSYPEYITLHVPETSIVKYQLANPWKKFKEIVALPKYLITYFVDGNVYREYSYEVGKTIINEPNPEKEGYTFSGWSEIPETMTDYDVTITGTFTINKYKLTYLVDGEEYKSYEVEFGTSITPEAYPTKDDYTFSGWSDIPETMPAHDVTVTGTFTQSFTASGTCGENAIWTYDEITKTLTISGNGEMNDYTYNTSPWYDYRNGIQSVVIEDGVTSIGNHAFHDCMAITSLVIPNSMKSIGVQSFAYCYKLTSLTIPNGVNLIMNYAFWDCIGLSSITIPKNVTSIGDNPFSGCDNLSSITVDAENPIYDSRDNCNAIIESSTNKLIVGCNNTIIPNGVVAIGDYAFNACSSITNISIPSSVTSIGRDAFWCCKGITSLVLPDNIVSIGSGAFFFCNSLASINIPNSVTSIGSGAFNHCSGLSSFDIPNSVSSIEKFTFAYCDNLVSVTIPSSIVSIGDKAFFECNNLTSVIIEKQVPVEIEDSVFTNRTNATLYVPAGCRNAYAAAEYWMEFKEIVEPKFKLTYYVDGNEYKTAEMEYNTIIIPETEPIREGYTFSGWSEIPETMPAEDVTVTGSFTVNQYRLTYYVDGEVYTSYYIDYGAAITPEAYPTKVGYDFTGWSDVPETMPAYDVTITGSFEPHYNVGNVASLIDFILNGSGSLEDFELYDMNGDGELNIGDLILILREVLKNTGGSAPSRGAVEWVEPDFTQYTAAQFVLDVPLYVKEQDIQLAEGIKQTHKMMSRQIVPGRFAVVVYSLTNSKLAPGFIEVKAEKTHAVDLDIKDMVLAKPTGETVSFGNMAVATAVSDVRCENAQRSVYDLKGRKQGNSLQKGVYIENGKKIVIR